MEKTHQNYKDYRSGKEPLKNAVLQHPEGSKEYDYLKREISRDFWVIPFGKWEKKQKKLRSK